MRPAVTVDDAEDLDLSGTPEHNRAAACTLQSWAAEPHPDDELSSAALLVRAGEHLTAADDHEASLALVRRAVEDGGDVDPDVRCYLLSGLLRVGATAEARGVVDELRRSRPVSGDVYLFVGEVYEGVGDLDQANRWFTTGVMRLLRREDDARPARDAELMILMAARARVREALGFPADDLDEEAQQRQAAFARLLEQSS